MASCITREEYERTTDIIDLDEFECTYPKIYSLPITDFQEKYASIVLDEAKKTLQFFRKHLFKHNLRKIKIFYVTVDDMKFVVKHESDHWENTLKKIEGEIHRK